MIVDSSALIALLRSEPDCARLADAIKSTQFRRMSAASYVETAIVVDNFRDPVLSRRLDEFLTEANITIEPVTVAQAHLARDAYRDFGRGSGHPARLNFGDCFSYALAKDKAEPLLFKGEDFGHTDIVPA
jgi:ribonuclease VapC